MASGMSDTWKEKLLDHLCGEGAGLGTTPRASAYLALYTDSPTATAAGTEVSHASYERVDAIAKFTPAGTTTAGEIENDVAIEFAEATGAWGVIDSVALCVSGTKTTDDAIIFLDLDATKSPVSGETVRFAAQTLKFKINDTA